MALEQAQILQALRAVKDPDLHKDIVKLGFVKDVSIDGGRVAFTIELTTPACPVKEQMKEQARAAVMQLAGVTDVDITMTAQVRPAVSPDLNKAAVPGVKNVIAVGAGKGGVGQDHRGGEPRARAGEDRRARRHHRRRHLRPERARSCSASKASSAPTARRSSRPRSTASRWSRWAS